MTQIKEANDKSNPLVTKLNEVIDIIIDQNQLFDIKTIDTLKIQYQTAQKNLDVKIKSLSSIEEIDNEFKIKEKSIQYLKDTKKVFQEMFPPLLEILPQKFNDLTLDQKTVFKNFGQLGRNFQKRSMIYVNEVYSFQRKYKITNAEINQYGL